MASASFSKKIIECEIFPSINLSADADARYEYILTGVYPKLRINKFA